MVRPPHEVRRYYASFCYQAGSWIKPRRVVAKVEWHLGELYPRVGFIVTNRPAGRLEMFYNQRGTAGSGSPCVREVAARIGSRPQGALQDEHGSVWTQGCSTLTS